MTDKTKEAASALPVPSGYNILIALPEAETKTDGGILLPEDMAEREALATILGFVLKLGPDCYLDKEKFPTGPWCKEGDWILFRSYTGTRFKVFGQEFRMVTDDTVQAVVEDPQGYKRA
jgi:co-chaperonin GroES (HSP10)